MRYAALVLLLVLVGSAFAAPNVTGSSGTFADGEAVTFTGSGFGATGPNIIMFDDFEDGSDGADFTSGSAPVGTWNATSGIVKYSTDYSVSGSTSFEATMYPHWLNYAEVLTPANTRDVFVSYWIYVPSGGLFPGEGAGGINWKIIWTQGEDSTDDDLCMPSMSAGSLWIFFSNSGPFNWYPDNAPSMSKGSWYHVKAWCDGGSSGDGEAKYWTMTSGSPHELSDENTGVTTMSGGGYRERVRMNGYGGEASGCIVYFDDFYCATGASAQARVEIGNNSSYFSCTELAIMPVTSWADGSVSVTFAEGTLANDETAYVFITTAGDTTSSGYEIIMGGGGSPSLAIDTAERSGSNLDLEWNSTTAPYHVQIADPGTDIRHMATSDTVATIPVGTDSLEVTVTDSDGAHSKTGVGAQ